MDSFSPLSAARMLVQILPVGPITAQLLETVLEKLRDTGALELKDLPTLEDSGRDELDPRKFPLGRLSFCFTSSSKSLSHAILYPFETFREPLVVLGVVDGSKHDISRTQHSLAAREEPQQALMNLSTALDELRDNYPGALMHRLLIVDDQDRLQLSACPADAMLLKPASDLLYELRCMAAALLPELSGLMKSFQALQDIPSPMAASQGSDSNPASPLFLNHRNSMYRSPTVPDHSKDTKAMLRMSMPVPSSSPAESTGEQDSDIAKQNRAAPATTFDMIPEATPAEATNKHPILPVQPQSDFQAAPKERHSVAGFGSGVLNERSRTKQQGRLACLIGTLYMQCGFWNDALRELTDSAVKTKSGSDHLWHAKALENLTLCMLLLASHGARFKIPNVCQPSSFRPLAGRRPQSPTDSSGVEVVKQPEEVVESMRAVYEILPELIQMIRDLYKRTLDTPSESLPPFAYSEINIRFARLLIGLSAQERFSKEVDLILSTSFAQALPRLPKGKTFLRNINEMLRYTVPSPYDSVEIATIESISIVGAVVASYAALNMARKSALVLTDFLDCLIPSLIQARKIGAAEAGMHPAAGIANLQIQPVEAAGLKLADLLRFFQCMDLMPAQNPTAKIYDSVQAEGSNTKQNIQTKIILLRKCIKVCEALPDFDGILQCTAQLFTLACPGMAPRIPFEGTFVGLSPEEQAVLSGNMYRTSDLVDNLGLPKYGGTFWDPFLVRDIGVDAPQMKRQMHSHTLSEFEGAGVNGLKKGPFLHDAFARKVNGQTHATVIVAGESTTFGVTLQNLFDFEVHLDSLELVGDSEDFTAHVGDVVLAPRAATVVSLSGIARSAGQLKISGCRISPKACQAMVLDIIREPYMPQSYTKMSLNGALPTNMGGKSPTGFVFEVSVIEKQPLLTVADVQLFQRAVEVMEGERKSIKYRVINKGAIDADFIRVTAQDNIKAYLQGALKERDLQPPLRHALEQQLFQNPAVRCTGEALKQSISSEEEATYIFDIVGKPGLTHALLQVHYAHTGISPPNASIYTRLLETPFTVVTRPNIRVMSCHLSPVPQDNHQMGSMHHAAVWLTIDFKNFSNSPQRLVFGQHEETLHADTAKIEYADIIQPGRLVTKSMLIRKLYVEKPHAPIPSLDPTKERQFVVRQSGGAPLDERPERERFWYNMKLIDALHASWEDVETRKVGEINLRDISLTSHQVELLKLDDVDVSWVDEIHGSLGERTCLRLRVLNRSQDAVRGELQLQRAVERSTDRATSTHFDTQMLSTLPPGETVEVAFDCTFDSYGRHVFTPSVTERVAVAGQDSRHLRTWFGFSKHVTI